MTAIVQTQKPPSMTGHLWVTFFLILVMFILRLPLLVGYRIIFATMPAWVSPVFEIGTYLLVSVLLVWESQSLQDYHINNLAIWMVILFKPLETIYLSLWKELNSPLAFPKIPSLVIWLTTLGLLVYFRPRLFQRGTIRRGDLKWLLLGGVAGLGVVLFMCYPMSFQISGLPSSIAVLPILMNGFVNIPYQVGYAAVSEEPVFRGFLWGYLQKMGWRDVWIWLFQAGLFWLGHLFYINSAPISFWLLIPLGGLVLGWLAWRSRSIATSMAAHGVMNGLSQSMALLVASFRS
jgi:membrane protease YdiL (CAAX protease family)